MNELIFISQALIILICAFIALRLGKEALFILVSFQAVLANLFVTKQITLFGLNACCSDAFIVGNILCLNLIQEYFGKDSAKRASLFSFLLMIFFTLFSQIHLFYKPNHFDQTQKAFFDILHNSPRILISSIITFLIVQRIDIYFFGFLKKVFNDKHLSIRMLISVLISQSFDTIIFNIAALYGVMQNLSEVMILSFIIKMLVALFISPLLSILWKKNFTLN